MAQFIYHVDDNVIDTIEVTHLPEVSSYNYNIYKLPRLIKGLEISDSYIYSKNYKEHLDSICVLEECDDDNSACYTFGYLDKPNDKRKKGLEFKPVQEICFNSFRDYYEPMGTVIKE